jgi:hypothetical protein
MIFGLEQWLVQLKWEVPKRMIWNIRSLVGFTFVLIFPPKLYINIWVGKGIELPKKPKRGIR